MKRVYFGVICCTAMRLLGIVGIMMLAVGTAFAFTLTYSDDSLLQHLYQCGDNTYLYGFPIQNAAKIVRRDVSGHVFEGVNVTTYVATYTVQKIFRTATDSLIFAVIKDSATDKYFLLKSIDGGAHFGNNSPTYDNGGWVYRLGWVSGSTHITDVTLLQQASFCDAVIDGAHVLLAGEYNINGSRTPGSTNDQVRLIKSTDGGDTWSTVIEWNTDGSNNNIRHIHCIQQSPYNGDIWFGTGDDNDQSGIFRWNGTSDISGLGNHDPSWYETHCSYAADGFSVGVLHDVQKYRVGNFAFVSATHIIWTADATTVSGTRGIWKAPIDQSASERVDNAIESYTDMNTFTLLKTSTGKYICTNYLNAMSMPDSLTPVAVSDDGTTWRYCGSIGVRANTGSSFFDLFEWNGKIYCPSTYLAYNFYNYGGTMVWGLSDGDTGTAATMLTTTKMVFYIDAVNGSNSNRGNNPAEAWKTLGRLQSYNYFDQGNDIVLASGQTFSAADSGLVVPTSGTASYPITYRSSIAGKPAYIDASTRITSWQEYDPVRFPNLYYTTITTLNDTVATTARFNGVLGTRYPTLTDLSANNRWQSFISAGAGPDTLIFFNSSISSLSFITISKNNCIITGGKSFLNFRDIHARHGSGTYTTTGSGAFNLNGGTNIRIIRCRADSSAFYGFNFNGADYSRIESSIAFNNSLAGIRIRSTSDSDTLYNNTVSISQYNGFALNVEATANQPVVKNNVLVNNAAGYAVKILLPESITTSYAGNNNVFYSGQANFGLYGTGAGTAYSAISTWRTATGQDAASVLSNPLFKSVSTGDLRPTALIEDDATNSPMINMGDATIYDVIHRDYKNRIPVGTMEAGAYEVTTMFYSMKTLTIGMDE